MKDSLREIWWAETGSRVWDNWNIRCCESC